MNRSAQSDAGPPSSRSRAHNRRALLDAAGRLLSDGSNMSMADVARESGLTRATVYRHFPDRETLLCSLLAELAAEAVPELLARLEGVALGPGMDIVAHTVVEAFSRRRHLIAAVASRFEQTAREAVSDEPIQMYLRGRRAAGDLTVPQPDDYLAAAVRALCLATVHDMRESAVVAADLAELLRRVVGAPA